MYLDGTPKTEAQHPLFLVLPYDLVAARRGEMGHVDPRQGIVGQEDHD